MMTIEDASQKAARFKRLVARRTGLKPRELVCPREQSDMTPCVARDGSLAVAGDYPGNFVCVGCGASVEVLLAEEEKKHKSKAPTP